MFSTPQVNSGPLLRLLGLTMGLSAAVLSGCDSLDEFEETITDETTIPGTLTMTQTPFQATYSGGLNGLDLSKAKTFQNNGVAPVDVDAIYVKALELSIDMGAGAPAEWQDVSRYVQSFTISVSAPGLETKEVAKVEPIPMGQSVSIPVSSTVNLKPYAESSSMTFSAAVKLKMAPPVNAKLTTGITLLIDINLLGA